MYPGEGILRLAHSTKGSGSNDSTPPRGSRGQIPSDTLEEDGSQSRTIIVLRPLKLSSSPQRGRINGQRSPTGESRPQECLQREELVYEEVRVVSHSLSAGTLTTR